MRANGWTMCRVAVAALVAGSAGIAGLAGASSVRTMRLAAGDVETGHYVTAGRLQHRVNTNAAEDGFMLTTIATAGAADSLAMLADGRADLALAQSDMLAAADGLTALGTVASERFVVVVRDAGGPVRIEDLVGARVGLGAAGSGSLHTAVRVLDAAGIGIAALRENSTAGVGARTAAFCAGRLDAVAYVVPPADPLLDRLTGACGGRVIDFGGPDAAALRAALPGYAFATITGATGTGATATTLRIDTVLAAASHVSGASPEPRHLGMQLPSSWRVGLLAD